MGIAANNVEELAKTKAELKDDILEEILSRVLGMSVLAERACASHGTTTGWIS